MKKIIFVFFFYCGVILVCLLFIPSFIMPQRVALFGGKLLGLWVQFCLKVILSVKIRIIGKDNVLNNEKFFIACTHQSAFETYYLQVIFSSPVFILKKELTKIPIFGWYLKKIGSISIDRNKVTRENLNFIEKIKSSYQKSNRPVVIFPQGTRVNFNEKPKLKKGASRIYKELNIKCQPVVMNSGEVWPKKGKIGENKTINIQILKPIEIGLNENDFTNLLEKEFYK
mgnify:CR=1 FL=1